MLELTRRKNLLTGEKIDSRVKLDFVSKDWTVRYATVYGMDYGPVPEIQISVSLKSGTENMDVDITLSQEISRTLIKQAFELFKLPESERPKSIQWALSE